jgi:hypothetical protein
MAHLRPTRKSECRRGEGIRDEMVVRPPARGNRKGDRIREIPRRSDAALVEVVKAAEGGRDASESFSAFLN